jgi:hypothetical protein
VGFGARIPCWVDGSEALAMEFKEEDAAGPVTIERKQSPRGKLAVHISNSSLDPIVISVLFYCVLLWLVGGM